MPYEGEYATVQTLADIVNSAAYQDFEGRIRVCPSVSAAMPDTISPVRSPESIKYLIAFDGSTVTAEIMNGYPGAEAALLNIAAVIIKLDRMRHLALDPIPGPKDVRELENCDTLCAILPGRNVVGRTPDTSTPKRFFRQTIYREMEGATLASDHETLLETFLEITQDREQPITCPGDSCEEKVQPTPSPSDCSACGEIIYPTDSLRAHERFGDHHTNEEPFTAAMSVIEHLSMVNVVRWFDKKESFDTLGKVAFIVDGPLALFGMPAWLKQHIQRELARVHKKLLSKGSGLFVMGVEKTGKFKDHMERLDWSDSEGQRGRIPPATALVPDIEYIHEHIVPSPPTANPYGSQTYYGRKIMYKTASGQHAVFSLPIVTEEGEDPSCVSEDAFPRVGDALGLLDELATYLYRDGFSPLVRAHLHAAVPLRSGTELLTSLFEDGP